MYKFIKVMPIKTETRAKKARKFIFKRHMRPAGSKLASYEDKMIPPLWESKFMTYFHFEDTKLN